MTEKVLVLDIDGTLTNSAKEITENTRRAIIDVQKRGHIVMLASGRPTPGMKRYAEELELEKYGGYLLSFNGGRIINFRTGEIVYQRILPAQVFAAASTGQPYSYRPPMAAGNQPYCMDLDYSYRYGTAPSLNS